MHLHNIIPYDKTHPASGFIKPCECGELFWMKYYCPKSTDKFCHYLSKEDFDERADKHAKINEPMENEDERIHRAKIRENYAKNNSHIMDKCIHCEQYDYGFGIWRKKQKLK